jgi:superfamily II DNA/RNA helicase
VCRLARGDAQGKEAQLGFNELHTLLREAVDEKDYMEAGRISDIVLKRLHGEEDLTDEERRSRRRRLSWKGLGASPWLTARLDALNYTFPTTIQINALEAVNAILGDDSVDASLQERIEKSVCDDKAMGVVVSGTTGSGKTLSFLVPLLSTLSDSLFIRQRLRVGAEEQVAMGDGAGGNDLLDRLAVVTSPQLRTSSRKPMEKGSKTIATGAALASLGSSGKDVKSPLALIVVPSKELGVQTAMLLYQLVGGNIKDSPDQISGRTNMFQYKGPKGIRIGCVLDDEEASFGLKLQTDVAITMPQYLGKLMEDGDVQPSKLRVVVYDEADLALEETPSQTLQRLFQDEEEDREYTRLTFLVGASVTPSLGNMAVSSRILPPGQTYIATATRFAALGATSSGELMSLENTEESMMNSTASQTASLQDLKLCLYPGLKHERAVVASDKEVLITLTRLLRKELQDYDQKVLAHPEDSTLQRPRVVVFLPDEARARAAIEPLRDGLWGEHRLCVLLPKTGVGPLTIMDQFKRNETTVMLATPNSVRGLDFPALTHVYTLYLPIEDPREYVHLAGRVGRIGQVGSVLGDGGHVISILPEKNAQKMQELADSLGFEFIDLDTGFSLLPKGEDGSIDTEKANVEDMRRYLEDQMTFLDLAEDYDPSGRTIDVTDSVVQDDEDDDDDEEEEEAFQ